jgi:catechol 2,3-dioxygenase-like lactoylglutathione lyase family enzyme
MLRLDHLGIAVNDLETAVARYKDLFQTKKSVPVEAEGHYNSTEIVTVSDGEEDDISFEIMEPSAEAGDIYDHLRSEGEGLYHLAFLAEDFDGTVERLLELQSDLRQKLAEGLGIEDLESDGIDEDLKLEVLEPQETYKHAMIHPCRYTSFVRIYIYNEKYEGHQDERNGLV